MDSIAAGNSEYAVTSTASAQALTPSNSSSRRTASFLSSFLPIMATDAPAAANASAMPRPMPPLPPVNTAMLLLRSNWLAVIEVTSRLLNSRCSDSEADCIMTSFCDFEPRRAMKRSIDRILTTHVGSLPRPDDLRAMLDARRRGEDYDHRAFESRLGSAVQETVNEQIEAGLDVINDGEMSKMSWSGYIRDRLGGYEVKPLVSLIGREQRDFPEYAQGRVGGRTDATPSMVATGPVEY